MKFLYDTWYCAGFSTDVVDKPVHRKLLGEDIVLFRDSNGDLNAISDKCPHRFAPLHQGKVIDDAIACPYHGLRFDGSGTCVLNPHGSGQVPPGPHVTSFPVEERTGTIWVWMGDPAKVDPEKIIEVPFLKEAEKGNYAYFTGHHPIKCNYFLIVDNLLDLTHAQFLHPETVFGIGSDDRWAVNLKGKPKEGEEALQEVWFEESEDSLTAHMNMRDKPLPPLFAPIVDVEKGDLYSRTIWYAPANMDLLIKLPSDDPEVKDPSMTAMHFITPIDEHNCYYFIAVGWNANTDSDECKREVHRIVTQTIDIEDGPMVEDCQAYMGETTDLFELKPLLLQTDGVAIKARRRMEKILEEQDNPVPMVESVTQ